MTWMTAALLLPILCSEAAPSPKKILIYPMRSSPSLKALAGHLTEEIVLSLDGLSNIESLSHSELKLSLLQLEEQGCSKGPSNACLKRLIALSKADSILTGSVGRVDAHHLVTLSLLDAESMGHIASSSFLVEKQNELDATLTREVRKLVGEKTTKAPAYQFRCEHKEKCRAAIFPIEDYGTDQTLAQNLSELLSIEMKRAKGLEVISHHDIKTVVSHRIEQDLCFGQEGLKSCMLLIRKVLKTEYAVASALGKLEDTYILHLKLVRLKSQESGDDEIVVEHRVSESVRGSKVELAKAVKFATARLLGRALHGEGDLMVTAKVEGQLEVAHRAPLKLPQAAPLQGLLAGRHPILIQAEGYLPFDQEVYVLPGVVNRFEAQLELLPTPWYKSWWFWTITGVAVAGAAAGTTIYLMLEEPTAGGGVINVRRNP